MERATTSTVVMVRPTAFGPNEQTRKTNRFQAQAADAPGAHERALTEFDGLHERLKSLGIEVIVIPGQSELGLPDEIFPNNWFSTHDDGTIVLYPMLSPNRRLERLTNLAERLTALGYRPSRTVDLTAFENKALFLEGTGSLVLDRSQRIAYAALSARTHAPVLDAFEHELGYRSIRFATIDSAGIPVYHTNVLMSLGTRFAIICTAVIADAKARRNVCRQLEASGREIVEISEEQMSKFAGNALQLIGKNGPIIALSARALASLTAAQTMRLSAYGELLATPFETIESVGGGGVRCALAEIALPRNGR